MKNNVVRERVFLCVYGRFSKALFIRESEYQAWLQTIPVEERACVTRVETDLEPQDADFIQRSQAIIDRAELEAREASDRVTNYLKSRKKTA